MKKNKINRYAADLGISFAGGGAKFAQIPRKRQILPLGAAEQSSGNNYAINWEKWLKMANTADPAGVERNG